MPRESEKLLCKRMIASDRIGVVWRASGRTMARGRPKPVKCCRISSPIGYNLPSSYAYGRYKAGAPIGIVMPRDYTLILSRTAMIPVKAGRPDLGKKFLNYCLSSRARRRSRNPSSSPSTSPSTGRFRRVWMPSIRDRGPASTGRSSSGRPCFRPSISRIAGASCPSGKPRWSGSEWNCPGAYSILTAGVAEPPP